MQILQNGQSYKKREKTGSSLIAIRYCSSSWGSGGNIQPGEPVTLPQTQFPICGVYFHSTFEDIFTISFFLCRFTQTLHERQNMYVPQKQYVRLNFHFQDYQGAFDLLSVWDQGSLWKLLYRRGKRHISCTKADGPSPVTFVLGGINWKNNVTGTAL